MSSGIDAYLNDNKSESGSGSGSGSGCGHDTSSWSRRAWLDVTIASTFCCACLLPSLHVEISDEFRVPMTTLADTIVTTAVTTPTSTLCAPPHEVEVSRHVDDIHRGRQRNVQLTKRAFVSTAFLVVCGACTKTTSYAASNWMPGLELGYWSYALGSVVGTVISAIVVGAVDVIASSFSLLWRGSSGVATISIVIAASSALTCLAITGCIWVRLWCVDEYALAFGIVSAFVSTTLSVCMCAAIGDECGRYGRTTAHADGGATLIAAALQPCARSYFVSTQVGATTALVLILGLMLSLELERSRSRTRTHKLELEREQ